MNLVGKILTVIVLLFSIVFLSVAVMVFQTHRVWRDIRFSFVDRFRHYAENDSE